ncbi:lysosomal amino acid transporter 1 [Strongylocentrotus purpuratus]|uniref:Uncharacterized protein n=1 Tax=Strongylocentrotus purpuratus TaxID=7668 RepID=A0A7M7GM88_STRPU|nr:lysosomal amino acid transporter 1 [Strongylocentrotus purpuratus]XP_011663403.1 lysosomal amino acid transporter 1 [Strongylocentrotus purpuratus]|eukprot:XP_003729188.1 PREDICTED: lysosomal amino acid transporter 1 [Strongylocentrotus purpuratus]
MNVTMNHTTSQGVVTNASTTTVTIYTTSTMMNSTMTNATTTAMTTWLTTNTSGCPEGLTWIRDHFGDCVETTTQLFAFSCAMIGVALWIIGHFFLLKSYRSNPDFSCYHLGFIFLGGLGSVCSLVGTTLCDQLGTQILTACYLVLSEFVLLVQWIYWWNRNRKLNKQGLSFYVSSEGWKSPDRTRDENTMNGGGNLVLCLICPLLMTACYLPIRFSSMSLPWQTSYASHTPGRKLLMVSDSATDNFGYAMGFTALFLYSSCNIPTIVNIMRHKTSYTVSMWYHGLVIAANVFYFISIIAHNTDPVFLTNALPWLLISLFFIFFSSIIIFLVLRNRGIGSHTRPVGRRRPDGTFLLYPSEESLSSDLDRGGTLRFTDDTASGKLPSIQEEPHLENTVQKEAEGQADFEDVELDDDYDAETASIHSRASDFIMDDEEEVYDRDQEERQRIAKQRRAADFEDDGLEWDFDDFRPKYTGSAGSLDEDLVGKSPPSHLRTLGAQHDHGNHIDDDEEWDEDKVLGEIERELKMGDDIDGDTISMEYDTADDDDHFDDMKYSYTSHSQ